MKRMILIALGSVLTLSTQAGSGPDGGLKAFSYSVSERGPHHRVWQKVVTTTDEQGKVSVSTNQAYVELAGGMHYQNASGQWIESTENIEILPQGGAVARNGQHKVAFAGNLNS